MGTNILRRKGVVRSAVIALAVGLATLATLALWSTNSTNQATMRVRAMNDVSAAWSQVFLDLGVEGDSLNDFLRAGSAEGRTALDSVLDSAGSPLDWLATHGDPSDRAAISLFRATYTTYTDTLRQVLDAAHSGRNAEVSSLAQEVGLGSASLRKQVTANLSRHQLEFADYLQQVSQASSSLRLAASIALSVDFLLLSLCALILLSHQRRVERQAVESHHRSLHDALTGLGNRVLLHDRLEEALTSPRPPGALTALLLLDLDKFKEVNDTLGHHYGDLLLGEVARRLSSSVRESDTVARLGGDEFAVVLPRIVSAQEAVDIAERVLGALERPACLDSVTVDVAASLGVALYPRDSANTTELLQHADMAMYTAKRGRLGVVCYDPTEAAHAAPQLNLLGELRRALDEGELVLHYQPKICAATGDVLGVEALARWQHPVRGLLGPGEFIAEAEDSPLIHPLTDHVVRAALAAQDQWRARGMLVSMAVNIATPCLLEATFVDRVAGVLDRYPTARGQLIFEITEGALIADPDRVIGVLGRLQELGIELSIDDFGTGYASMAYLQQIPLHELKIDRRFITRMQSSPGDKAIARAVLEMAHALNLHVVAEGVEDEATVDLLVQLGCDVLQGFYFSRPLNAQAMTSWLTRRITRQVESRGPLRSAASTPPNRTPEPTR